MKDIGTSNLNHVQRMPLQSVEVKLQTQVTVPNSRSETTTIPMICSLKPDFHSHFSRVAGNFFALGMHKLVKPLESDENYLLLCSHLKFKYFDFCEIFLQRNQSDFFVKSRGAITVTKKILQNGRLTV